MASINISLPDPMRDYVQERIERGQYASASDYFRHLISRDQEGAENQKRWLRDLDMSIFETLAEMNAGGGVELVTACNAALTNFERSVRPDRNPPPLGGGGAGGVGGGGGD